MKKILLTICLLFSLPPVIAQEAPLYEQITSNVPELGKKTEVYLGDRMLIQREGEYRECIIPKITLEKRAMAQDIKVKAKQPLCKKDADHEYFHSINYKLMSTLKLDSFVKLVEKKSNHEIHVCQAKMFGKGGTCPKSTRFNNIDKKDIDVNNRYFIYTENTFQQSIEYAGRDEDNLKFTYSEFTDGFARQAFTRDFQIDFSKGDVTAYKGAIIKIHEATNINIIYEVIRNFQE